LLTSPRTRGQYRNARNPLDVMTGIARRNAWPLQCSGDDELTLCVEGKHANYEVFFTWMRELEIFHLACAFETRIPKPRRPEVQRLIARINERLWLGHFELWMEDGTVMFRESILLVGGLSASIRQCEAMLASTLDTCERYYSAFEFVLAAKSAGEALKITLFETVGEA
jgi:hypothetical protein